MGNNAFSPSADSGYYCNPIFNGDCPDPSILRDGNDYYMTHSSERYRPGLPLWHSRNLVDWEPLCFVCQNISGGIWAPDLSEYRGRYYIYVSVHGSNFVVTADSIRGPWSDPVDLKIGMIDPCHCTDADGNRYLFFSEGNIVALAQDGLSIKGKVQKVYDGWEYPRTWHTEGMCLEAPKIVKRGEFYYLTVAEGGTAGPATSHMVVSARSRSLFGPWEDSPYNPIVHCRSREETWWNRGHATLLSDTQDKWWLVYHAYEKDYMTLGRRTLLEPVEWTPDGWFRIPDGVFPDRPIRRPCGEAVPGDFELNDDFRGPKPRFQWRFFNGYDESRYHFLGEGGVQVDGKGSLPGAMAPEQAGRAVGQSNPMACMARDHSYEVSCRASLSGDAEGGLLLFYNEVAFCGLGLGREGIHLYRSGRPCGLVRLRTQDLWLKIVNECNDLQFFYSADGSAWDQIDMGMETSGYHHNVLGGYLSLRPSLYSVGRGSVLFRTFRYRPLD